MASRMSQEDSKSIAPSANISDSGLQSKEILSAEDPENHATTEPIQDISPESSFVADKRFWLAFLSLCVITLMAALDATSLSVALPIIAKALHGSGIEAFWAGTSFLLTSTVWQPVIGSFSHIFGRKPLIFISLALFLAGAIIAALADNFTLMLVGRSIQGTGGGGVICLTEIVVTDMVPLAIRGQYFSLISAMWALGTVVGPITGGGFSQNVSWRWILWLNLPFIGIGAPMIFFFLKLHYKTSSMMAKLRRVDWIGGIIFIGSTTGFLIPITWGGIMYEWSSWRTLVPLIICGLGLIVFVLHQEYIAPEPLIRTAIFKNRTAAVTYITTLIHGIVLWSILYYGPLYYEGVKGLSPIMTGVAMFPQCLTVAPAAAIVGPVIAKTGRYRWATWSGWFITTLGFGVLIYLKPNTPTVSWVFMNLVSGLGTGMLFPAMAIASQAAADPKDAAYAATMFSFIRAFGQTIGVAIGGVIFQNELKKKLLSIPALAANAVEYSKDASGLVEMIKALPDDSPIKYPLRASYTDALTRVYIVMCALSFVALLLSLLSKGLPLNRELTTEQGLRRQAPVSDEEKN